MNTVRSKVFQPVHIRGHPVGTCSKKINKKIDCIPEKEWSYSTPMVLEATPRSFGVLWIGHSSGNRNFNVLDTRQQHPKTRPGHDQNNTCHLFDHSVPYRVMPSDLFANSSRKRTKGIIMRDPKLRTTRLIDNFAVGMSIVQGCSRWASHKETFRYDLSFSIPSVDLI